MPEFRPPEKQRRSDGRLRLAVSAQYRLENHIDWRDCKVLDISTGGFMLEAPESFYVDDKVMIRLPLDTYELESAAKVTNIAGRKAGCQFIDLSDEHKTRLRDYIHRNLGF